jgi:hypothetical protein
MTEAEVLALVADTLNMDPDELGTDLDTDHTEWDSVDVMALLGVLQRAGVPAKLPDDWRAIHSLGGILGLFRAANLLE